LTAEKLVAPWAAHSVDQMADLSAVCLAGRTAAWKAAHLVVHLAGKSVASLADQTVEKWAARTVENSVALSVGPRAVHLAALLAAS
jgi:hypothetical protein